MLGTIIASVLFAAVAYADTITTTNAITAGTNTGTDSSTKAPGSTGTVFVYLDSSDNETDPQNGCNATGSNPATLSVTSGNVAKVTINSPGSVEVTGCGASAAASIGYSVSNTATAGPVTITVAHQSGGRGGSYTSDTFTVNVTAPADTTAPDTTIDAAPDNPTNNNSASFSFSGTDNVTPAGSLTFECKLDDGAWESCTSPKSYSSLSDGEHTFQVRAKDAANNVDGSPAEHAWTIDTVAPDTTIASASKPSNPTNSQSASFEFSSNETGSSFQCSLDSGDFANCTSPKAYSGLAEGSHTFEVKATDAAGNTDASPASFTWYVDLTPPNTQIDAKPGALSNNASPSFAFSGSDDHSGVTFECKLDSGSFATCTSPTSYSNLADGSHTFEVRAKDAAGNVDPTPASWTWEIDATAPDTSISSAPAASSNTTSASFSFSGVDNRSAASALTFECKLDGGAWETCTSPKSYSGLNVGPHTFQVRATDEAGNTDASPASHSWSVQYAFNGFFQPVDNRALNGMKAGSTAPIKFQLLLDGQYVTSTTVVTKAMSGVMACDASAPVDNLEEYATGGTSLRYDATSNQFIYNWQSPKQPGKCYKVVLYFADGTSQSASFNLR